MGFEYLGLLTGRLRRLSGLGAHPGVDLDVEQPTQETLPTGGIVGEELGEVALGQHDGTSELGEVEAEELLDRFGQLFGPRRKDRGCVLVDLGELLEPGLSGGGAVGVVPVSP